MWLTYDATLIPQFAELSSIAPWSENSEVFGPASSDVFSRLQFSLFQNLGERSLVWSFTKTYIERRELAYTISHILSDPTC
jgi:hypothetical protein